MAQPIGKKRPKNLDLTTIRLPLPGKVSILHRVSGAGLFLFLPLLLWLFQSSLTAPAAFDTVRGFAAAPLGKLILLGLIWAYLHHFCAGIRFLLLDLQIGVEKEAAVKTSAAVLVVSIALTALIAWRVLL
ncbi:MAG: succinate dehydrogenase, cytochrome b556 subunit [Betaproteobacteria bacterium]